jgi:hypothetical protein
MKKIVSLTYLCFSSCYIGQAQTQNKVANTKEFKVAFEQFTLDNVWAESVKAVL